MQLVRLGPKGDTSYLPDLLIEGYTSLVWTERFQSPGDFELVTPDIDNTRQLIPRGTFVSILESAVVMMVETHFIEVDELGNHLLKVSGRSVDFIFEHRHVEAPYSKKRKMSKSYPLEGAALVLMWNAIDNDSGVDVTRAIDMATSPKDKVPNVMITDNATTGSSVKPRWLREGPLHPQLADLMIRGDMGIRTIRPNTTNATKVRIGTGSDQFGEIIREYETDEITQLRFDLYTGVRRTNRQSDTIEPVIFNTVHGDIDKATYLFSDKDFKNCLEVMSGKGGHDIYLSGGSSATGWERRVMSYDAGEPDEPTKPTYPGKNASNADQTKYETDLAEWQNKVAEITAEFLEDAYEDAKKELKRHRRVSLFDGEISPSAPYKYGVHYNLGDKVLLVGDYNQEEVMLVSEYVRTDDEEGERGFPGLTTPIED